MSWLVASLAVLSGGAFLCLALGRRPVLARIVGPAVAVAGCVLGLVPTGIVLAGGCLPAMRAAWSVPFGSWHIELDPLSAVFSAPILLIAALAAIYGAGYLRPFEGKKNLGAAWFHFNLLTASMLLVVVARNAMLFLLAWELMSLASFFLVIFEHEHDSARRAGWTYLIATHIGTAFLLVLFALLGRHGGTLEFDGFALGSDAGRVAGAAFVLAVIGFGTKAGFMPLHVWLPEAHPAAPSHVSAVMSGVMIKTGVYGLVRILTYLGFPPAWWGWSLLTIGAVSGILGILFALAQSDLKRFLAYSSVENIGIVAIGLGIGLLGTSYGIPVMAFMGFAGALLHVINHAIFKGLLFLSAGSVLHAAATREIDRLGGLLKRMPVTGMVFLVGALAICGLPPFNGFVSEFLIYVGALRGVAGDAHLPTGALAAGMIAIASLALIGGLALACFTRTFGVVFLGEPRTEHASHAHEAGAAMRIPMIALACACAAIGLAAPCVLALVVPAVAVLLGSLGAATEGWNTAALAAGSTLAMVSAAAAGLLALSMLLALLRLRLLKGRAVAQAVTWDCGYAAPTPRMQYTASSFAQPITRMFGFFLGTRRRFQPPAGLFPASSAFSSDTPDLYRERMYRPAFSALESALSRLRWMQHGRLNLYILYIVVTLLVLLAWKLR